MFMPCDIIRDKLNTILSCRNKHIVEEERLVSGGPYQVYSTKHEQKNTLLTKKQNDPERQGKSENFFCKHSRLFTHSRLLLYSFLNMKTILKENSVSTICMIWTIPVAKVQQTHRSQLKVVAKYSPRYMH
jgi:hypothetical protein